MNYYILISSQGFLKSPHSTFWLPYTNKQQQWIAVMDWLQNYTNVAKNTTVKIDLYKIYTKNTLIQYILLT